MPAKLIVLNIKDLDNLMRYLEDRGFTVTEGEHMVLTDNSEVSEYQISRNDRVCGILLAHYISQYYKTIIENKDKSDDELLRELIKTKHSMIRWRTPVNPVAVVTDSVELEKHLNEYKDEYPNEDARKYTEYYKSNMPNRIEIFTRILSKLLSSLQESTQVTKNNVQKGE